MTADLHTWTDPGTGPGPTRSGTDSISAETGTGPESAEPAGPGTGPEPDRSAPLEGLVIPPGKGLPAILPTGAGSREILLATTEVRARRAAHLLAYHGLRTPVYLGRFLVRGLVGTTRGVIALYGWITHAEAAPLRARAIAQADADQYLLLYRVRQDHMRVRGAIAALTGLAAAGTIALQAAYLPARTCRTAGSEPPTSPFQPQSGNR